MLPIAISTMPASSKRGDGSRSSRTASARSRCSSSCSARSCVRRSAGAACASLSSSFVRSPPSERTSTPSTRPPDQTGRPRHAFPADPRLDPGHAAPPRRESEGRGAASVAMFMNLIRGPLVEGSGWSGIGAAHFGAGLFGREHPFQVCAGAIALALPGGDFALEFLAVVDAPVQALSTRAANPSMTGNKSKTQCTSGSTRKGRVKGHDPRKRQIGTTNGGSPHKRLRRRRRASSSKWSRQRKGRPERWDVLHAGEINARRRRSFQAALHAARPQ